MKDTQSKVIGAKIVACLLGGITIGTLVLGAIEAPNFGVAQWLTILVATAINFVVVQYPRRLKRSDLYFSVKEPVLLWSTLWLGIGGAVILAFITGVINYKSRKRDFLRWTIETSATTISAAAAGFTCYSVLRYGEGITVYPLANDPIGILILAAAVTSGAIAYELCMGILYAIYLKAENTIDLFAVIRENWVLIAITPIVVLATVLLFQLIVVYFSVYIGVLALPIAFAAHFAYRFHRQMLAQKTKEIREANRIHVATVEALATAIDARDQVGRGHVSRTQIYAIGIGKALGLSSDEIHALRTGSLLHDIGKLAVPDHILNKPGQLTPGELEKMKIHPVVGASILEIVKFPYPVVSTVRHHHEAWDGSGYPHGLKKDEIPLTARILAVADAYDTIRGARPYRKPVSKEEGRRFIMNSAGKQFDPRIVDIFLRNLNKFDDRVTQKALAYHSDEEIEILNGSERNTSPSYVEQIKRANREVYTLYELARVFSASLNLEETLSLFVTKIDELVPYDTCVVYLLDENENVATARHVEGRHADSLKNRKIKIGQGATGYTLKKKQPVHHINPGLDFSFYQMEFINEYKSMASLPLIANEKVIGAVSMYSCSLEAYEDEHMRLLETLSRIASDAISSSLRHAESENRAYTDAMTNLPNARSLQIQFDKEVARAVRNKSKFQLLMLDLDGFKAVNDTYGHKAGDQLLQDISNVMRGQLRDYDFLARYAGDEFVAIIPDTTRDAVLELCQRMSAAVKGFKLDVGNGGFASVGVSLGASTFPDSGESLDSLIIAADKEMYAVKGRRKAEERDRKMLEVQASIQAETELKNQARIDAEPVFDEDSIESLIVELDETHVVPSRGPIPRPKQ